MAFLAQLSPAQQFALFSAVKVAAAVAVVLFLVAYTVYVERRVAAFIQDRLGPNRVGPFGLLQPMADGLKAFLKEDFTPDHVRKAYFWLAPGIAMLPGLITLAVIPFGSTLGGSQKMVIADLNVGVLYTFGIVSLGVYGIVLAGYAANSKYPFLGGIRSSAQMISYELSMGLSVIPIFMIVGNLNLSGIIAYQSAHGWMAAPFLAGHQTGLSYLLWPCTFLSFAIFLAAAFAETNRLPFDMPEAEQELAGGYNIEYSSIRFALFFMGEYANVIASSAMMVTLFLGGWTLPWFGLDQPAQTLAAGVAHILIFLAKTVLLVLMFIWVRWMWPRFRYDQLMDLGWRRFLPLALANIVVTALLLFSRPGEFMIVARKPLSLAERLYLPAILNGFKVTLRHFFKKKVTLQYPEERPSLPPGYRGAPYLVRDQEGNTKCVSCQLCEFVCPPKAIKIIPPGPQGPPADRPNAEKMPLEFEINMLRCIFCGYCQEVCPEEAIFLMEDYSLIGVGRQEMIFNKTKLLALGGIHQDRIQKWKQKAEEAAKQSEFPVKPAATKNK